MMRRWSNWPLAADCLQPPLRSGFPHRLKRNLGAAKGNIDD